MGILNTVINVNRGTRHSESFTIDLDNYGTRHKVSSDLEEMERALDLLCEIMNDSDFANDGHRNNDAVNGCIALHVLGYDAKTWFEKFCAEQTHRTQRWFTSDLGKFMEHVKRVNKYLSKWGPEYNEGNALNYTLQ